MRALINQRLLTSLKAHPQPYEVRDVKVKGFILRVQPSGIMAYIVEYERGKRTTLGRAFILTPTLARTKADAGARCRRTETSGSVFISCCES